MTYLECLKSGMIVFSECAIGLVIGYYLKRYFEGVAPYSISIENIAFWVFAIIFAAPIIRYILLLLDKKFGSHES